MRSLSPLLGVVIGHAHFMYHVQYQDQSQIAPLGARVA
jgi:hypothetical protein